jgi:hypothetical protein
MTFAPTSLTVPGRDRAWWRQQAVIAAPAILTLLLATGTFVVGWQGVDQAAQTYRVWQFKAHGLMLWDSGWYGGNLPLGYSVLFPPVAALIGIDVAAVASAALATWSFDRMIRSYLGARPLGSWYFAASALLPVAIGQWPFLAGEAAGLAALVAIQKGKRPRAIVLGILAALFSPLAAAFLALGCLAWAAYATRRRGWMIATAAASVAVVGISGALFPGTGPFPYPWTGLVVTELLCLTVLTPLVRTTPAVRMGALIYAASALFSFIVPNPLGGNASRLAESIGVPLLACFLTAPGPALERLSHARLTTWLARGRNLNLSTRWRIPAFALVVPFALWQWSPGQLVVVGRTSPETQATFYAPLVAELTALQASGPIRVEIPPTLEHWESAYVAPHVSLARGWERQLDIADNPLFYNAGALTPTSYQAWLIAEGVSYVALANAPLDYAATAEGALLRAGRALGLIRVWSNRDWTVWRVQASPGLVSGPARLTTMEPDHLTLDVYRPGTITVRVRYTGYWSITAGQACVQAGPPAGFSTGGSAPAPTTQWTQIVALAAGPVEVSASVVRAAPLAACAKA